MSSQMNIEGRLKRIGRSLLLWRARVMFLWGSASLCAAAALCALADLLFRMNVVGRASSAALMLIMAAALAWLMARTLSRKFSPDGVAALLERACPEFDNRLINYVQFARGAQADPFKAAYISGGPPDLKQINYSKIRNHRLQLRGIVVLALAAAFLILPLFFVGQAWRVAILRIINPFAAVQPMTLTRLLEVNPGDAVVRQGDPAVLSVKVDGYPGHKVLVDVRPADSSGSTYVLGKISQAGAQSFSHALPKVNTDVRYRFRAGDAPPSQWHTLSARPPPALSRIRIEVVPPEYTGRSPFSLDARRGELLIPFGSLINLSVIGTEGLQFMRAKAPNNEPIELQNREGEWTGSIFFTEPGLLVITAEDSYKASLSEEITCRIEPDNPPVIEIISPTGRSILPPGETPRIVFHIRDDYGLSEILVEQIAMDQPDEAPGTTLQTWDAGNSREFRESWLDSRLARSNDTVAFRITASDNNPFQSRVARSAPIIFNAPPADEMADSLNKFEKQAMSSLNEVIDLQKTNIAQTVALRRDLAGSSRESWNAAIERQKRILSLTRDLLRNPIHPLGGQTETVNKLFLNEMPLAIEALQTTSASDGTTRNKSSGEALRLEETILRGLTAAQAAAERAAVDRKLSGLNAMLDVLISGQTEALKKTRDFADSRAKVSSLLVEKQDALASDTAEFVKVCMRDSESARQNEPAFADTLSKIASEAETRAIRNDMLLAAERLERNTPSEAIPFAEKALGNLRFLRDLLEGVSVQQQEAERKIMSEAIEQAKHKVNSIRKLHEQIIETMEAVRGQTDKNNVPFDVFMEEYKEMAKNTKEALLTVPTDLHIFTDLNAANDIIEDTFSVFEEVEQALDSENLSTNTVTMDVAFAKEQQLVDQMGEILKELDDREKWLSNKPEPRKVATESFDREEMPDSGISMGPLAAQVQDLIGDLLKESEETAKDSNDSATTHAMPDLAAGWDVVEGDISTFSADGSSGNQTPDHKEQDGRSGVGREGMSVGESAAGAGTLSEGDDNIEARRTEEPTQSGQVDPEGEGHAAATGGGKLATGKADEAGMNGGVRRMDSTEQGSWESMASLMARQADAIYAQASLHNVKVGSLKDAAHHLRQSADAVASGNLEQVKEFRNLAVSELRNAQVELQAGPTGAIDMQETPQIVDSFTGGGSDLAPQRYKDAVADYYKLLNESL